MRTPKAFIAEIASFGLAATSASISVVSKNLLRNSHVPPILAGAATTALGAGLVMSAARREKQNQRTLARLDKLMDGDLTAENTESLDQLYELSSRIENLPSWIDTVLDRRLRSERTEITKLVKEQVAAPESSEAPASSSPSAPPPSTAAASSPSQDSPRGQAKIVPLEETTSQNGEFVRRFSVDVDSYRAPYEPIQLTKTPLSVSVPVGGATEATVEITLLTREIQPNPKAALVTAKVTDDEGNSIQFQTLPSHSEAFGQFSYLRVTHSSSVNSVVVKLPRHANTLELSFYQWSGAINIKNRVTISMEGKTSRWLEERKATEVRVAGILDEFSYNSFKYECDLVALRYSGWEQQFDEHQPDLFLCESAWSGHDSEARPWKGRIYASENFKGENRGELLKILDLCRKRGIPTVFWNKEDPSHYDDKKHNFVDTALRFDHIFTTDSRSAKRYRLEHGHSSVHVLQFAVQPKLFNPIEVKDRTRDVVFAGSWYSNHVQRSADMTTMFDAVERSDRDLKIYDRFYGSDDPTKIFPDRFRYALNPPVKGAAMARVYKESEIGMTINTETQSPTMFARRIFELMACNTFVVSNYSNGVNALFGNDVLYLDQEPNGLKTLDSEQMAVARERNLRRVLIEHTYRKRFETILDVAKVPHAIADCELPIVVRVDDLETASQAFEKLRSMGHWSGSKTILLSNSVSNLDYADALTLFNKGGVTVVWEKLVLTGETPLHQVFSTSESIALVPFKEFVAQIFSNEDFELHQVHSQYVQVPIINGQALSANEKAERYSFAVRRVLAPALVQRETFLDLIKNLASKTKSIFYVI